MSSLRYVPLGGLGEVGLNMWALEWEGEVLVVDSGLMFPQEDMLGVDLVIPDVTYLLEEGRRVLGIVLSHGHEDHIGALPYVLKRLHVPVYGTRLTLGLVRPKLREHRVLNEAELREIRAGDHVQLGPFRVEPVAMCHSIPDAVALSIDTPAGRVFYTSDFKLDAAPVAGSPTDVARIAQIGSEGVMLLLSDSTNAEREGHSGSERELLEPLEAIFRDAPGRIVVATFASNIHRLQMVIDMAHAHERRVAAVGRSLQNNLRTGRELGYLNIPEGVVVPLEGRVVDDPKLVLLAAGAQGEPVSALARFASQRHPVVNVKDGDWVVISARPIPGNEKLVHQTINNLYRHGAKVFYSEVGHVHVSGHAHREELKLVLTLIKPRFFIPVHGEYRQLHHHAELAREVGIPPARMRILEDGQSVEFDGENMRAGPPTGAGFVYVDGLGIGDVEQVVLRDRRRLSQDGVLFISVALDRDSGNLRSGPDITSRGFIEADGSDRLMADLVAAARTATAAAAGGHVDTAVIQEAIHDLVEREVFRRTKRRPLIIPLVTDL